MVVMKIMIITMIINNDYDDDVLNSKNKKCYAYSFMNLQKLSQ